VIGIGAALSESFIRFTVFEDVAAVRLLELDTIDGGGDAAVLIQILEGSDDDLLRSISRAFTIGFAISFRQRTGQRSACGIEVDAVEVFDQFYYVAGGAAAATIKDLLLDIDSEPIVATALRTCTDAFEAFAPQLYTAALDLAFDGYSTGALYPILVFVAPHGTNGISSSKSTAGFF
jgi:hypothetical protein